MDFTLVRGEGKRLCSTLGEEHPDTLESMGNLAVLQSLGGTCVRNSLISRGICEVTSYMRPAATAVHHPRCSWKRPQDHRRAATFSATQLTAVSVTAQRFCGCSIATYELISVQDARHYRRHGQVLVAYRDDWRWEDHHAARDDTTATRRVQGNGGRRRHAEPSQMDIPVTRPHRVEKPIALCGPLTPWSER